MSYPGGELNCPGGNVRRGKCPEGNCPGGGGCPVTV